MSMASLLSTHCLQGVTTTTVMTNRLYAAHNKHNEVNPRYYIYNTYMETQLYKSFIESRFLYCIILFFDHMYSNQRSEMRSIVKEAKHKGVCIENTLDEIIEKRCKNYVLRSFQDDEHIIHSFLDRLPSGRLRNHKVRSNIGQVCFYTKMIKIINKNVF